MHCSLTSLKEKLVKIGGGGSALPENPKRCNLRFLHRFIRRIPAQIFPGIFNPARIDMDGIGQPIRQESDPTLKMRNLPIHRRAGAGGSATGGYLHRTVAGDPRIAFLHIAKTAGTSLLRMIAQCFGPGELITQFPDLRTDALGHFLRSDFIGHLWSLENDGSTGYVAISGHIPLCPGDSTPHPLTYVSFLRNPLTRLVSGFTYGNRHAERSDEQFLAVLHQSISLGASPGFDNSLTRLLSGRELVPLIREVSAWELPPVIFDDAKLAIENLSEFGFVGLTERFDDSCRMLSSFLKHEYFPVERLNVTERKIPGSEIPEQTKRAITYRHRQDIKVYLAAVERFNADARDAGLSEYFPPRFEKFAGKAISSGDFTYKTCSDGAFGDDPVSLWLSCDARLPIRGEYLGFDFGYDHHCEEVSVQLTGTLGEEPVRFFVEASTDEFRADVRRLTRIDVSADQQLHSFKLAEHCVSAPFWRLLRIPDGKSQLLAIASLSFGPRPATERNPDHVRQYLEAVLVQ